jgi:hypothetical protein
MRILAIAVLLPWIALPARPAEADAVEGVVRAVYETISGPAGARDWARFRSLFAPGARLINMRVAGQGTTPAVMTVEEYIARAGASFEKSPFYETERARRAEQFGSIAHVFSTYESRRAPNEKPFARGINSFQLVKDGGQWKVITILWDAEREGNPIPEKYLGAPAPVHIALAPGRIGISASPQPSGD